ncbi:hypothetical protein ACIGO9_31835 [Nocardia asteroides]|uniref:hypothetical protein n=1 Tax=Nocardia asteroides TaxID=1824 RepID=UPI0037C51B6A
MSGEFSDYAAARNSQGDYTIDEDALLAALPQEFLPVPVGSVLLAVADKRAWRGQNGLHRFRNWEKYFDSYVVTIIKQEPDQCEGAVEPDPTELVRASALDILRKRYADNNRVTVVDLRNPDWTPSKSNDPEDYAAAMPDAYTVRVIPRWDSIGVFWYGRFGFDQGRENRPLPELSHADPGFRTALVELVEPLVSDALDAARQARLADYANGAPGDVYEARDAIRPLEL